MFFSLEASVSIETFDETQKDDTKWNNHIRSEFKMISAVFRRALPKNGGLYRLIKNFGNCTQQTIYWNWFEICILFWLKSPGSNVSSRVARNKSPTFWYFRNWQEILLKCASWEMFEELNKTLNSTRWPLIRSSPHPLWIIAPWRHYYLHPELYHPMQLLISILEDKYDVTTSSTQNYITQCNCLFLSWRINISLW